MSCPSADVTSQEARGWLTTHTLHLCLQEFKNPRRVPQTVLSWVPRAPTTLLKPLLGTQHRAWEGEGTQEPSPGCGSGVLCKGFPLQQMLLRLKKPKAVLGVTPGVQITGGDREGGLWSTFPSMDMPSPERDPESQGETGEESWGGSRARERLTERQRQESGCLVGFVPLASADYCGLNMWRWVESGCASWGGAGYQEPQGPRRAS